MIEQENTPIFSTESHGKIMLTGEYGAMYGANVLAIPLKVGQTLNVYEKNYGSLEWEAYKQDELWHKVAFADKLDGKLHIGDRTNAGFAVVIHKVLRMALNLSNSKLEDILDKKFITNLNFNPELGLGSSSTLIVNVARYFNIDPFELNSLSFKGSGYDIAASMSDLPVIYNKNVKNPQHVALKFKPSFHSNLYFVYSGKKVSSLKAIDKVSRKNFTNQQLNRISAITTSLALCNNIDDFMELINEHEKIISKILHIPPLNSKQFYDFEGSIKSLGAWGGDMMLVATKHPEQYVENYFNRRGHDVIYKYADLALDID